MSKEVFEVFLEGGPKFLLEADELKDPRYAARLTHAYGCYSYSLYEQTRTQIPDLPQDLLLVGDNWYQQNSINANFKDAMIEDPLHDGSLLYIGRLKDRGEANPIESLLLNTRLQIVSQNYNSQRLLEKLTVFDRTSVGFPAISRDDIAISLIKKDGGEVVSIEGWDTKIFHVRNFELLN